MNWFDVLVLVVIGGGALRGLSTGIIREALSIIGLAGGIILAGQRYQGLAEVMTFISDERVASVVAFIAIFVAVMVAANLLGQIIHRVAKLAMMGCVDRMLGFVFGAVEAIVIIQIVMVLLLEFPLIGSLTFVQESTVGIFLMKYSSYVLGILPAEFSDILALLKTI